MATLNEIAYNIKNLAYGGKSNTEANVTTKQIKTWIAYHRANMIREIAMKSEDIPGAFYQEFPLRGWMDAQCGLLEGGFGDVATNIVAQNSIQEDWSDYVQASTSTFTNSAGDIDSYESIIFSQRSISEANIPFGMRAVVENEDYYGRDFYDQHTYEEKADYGHVTFYIPQVLDLEDNIVNLRVKKSHGAFVQNHDTIDIPVISEQRWKNKKFNRFSNAKSVAGYVMQRKGRHVGSQLEVERLRSYADGEYGFYSKDLLRIGFLFSHLRQARGSYMAPTQFRFTCDLLLVNPKHSIYYKSDETTSYPVPESMIPELVKRVLSNEMNYELKAPYDPLTDNADTNKVVRPQVQKQVPKR